MKVIFAILTLILLGHIQLLAQDYFKPGTITKIDGNSTSGFISVKSLKKMGRFIMFKESENGPKQKLYPEDVQLFNFEDGKHYISKTITDNDTETKVFLEYLVNGKANLYFKMDKYGEHYYIENDKNELYELKNTQKEVEVNEIKYFKDKREYIGVLNTILGDYSEINEETKDLKFNYKSLTKLTRKYHNAVCDEYECIVYKRDIKPKNSIGFLIGSFYSDINFDGNYLKRSSFSPSNSVTFAFLFSQKNLFGLSQRFAFNTQLGYRSHHYSSESYELYHKAIDVPLYLSYYFQSSKFQPLINLGFRNTFLIDQHLIYTFDDRNETIANPSSNYQYAFMFGVGAEYETNRFSYFLLANYEMAKGLSRKKEYVEKLSVYNAKNINISFGLKFKIN